MSILEVKNIFIKYNDNYVINDLSFNVDNGDYLCIVGENGSGKTTLMKAILGLIKVDSGEIIFSNELNNNEIAYLPQSSSIKKDFPATVKEVVLSGCLNRLNKRFFYNNEDKEIALKNIKKLNIENLIDKSFKELSGGQKQRVLLARALCANKKILLLDEPVTGLDPSTSNEMYKIIKQLNNEGLTIIMISHDIKEVIKYSKHILSINDEYFYGNKEEYLKKEGKIYA